MESMQASLDAETKGKADAIKQKKKLESDITNLEISLDHSNRTNTDLQKSNSRFQELINDLTLQVEDEQRQRDEAREDIILAERRVNIMTNELEEMRISLEQSDRFRKALETDIQDASERLLEISSHNSNLNVQKRKLETAL